MSRKSDCWDNACMESFFGSLKTEWVSDKKYKTREQARNDIFKYIELFYNRKRRHAALGYLSPAAYEKLYGNDRKQVAHNFNHRVSVIRRAPQRGEIGNTNYA